MSTDDATRILSAIATLSGELAALRANVSGDVATLRGAVATLGGELAALRIEVAAVDRKVTGIAEKLLGPTELPDVGIDGPRPSGSSPGLPGVPMAAKGA